MLRTEAATVHYGESLALEDVDIAIGCGEIVAVVGPNGAGKSSLALAVSRIVSLSRGRIVFEREDMAALRPHQVARRGIVHVPEGRGVLRDMTVRENLRLGVWCGRQRGNREEAWDEIMEQFPRLAERLSQSARTLSGGEQQMLVIARALLGNPRLLILDEPSLGLAPIIVERIFGIIKAWMSDTRGVLLVEQNLALTMKLADRVYIMSTGKVRLSGSTERLRDDARLRSAYLGGDISAVGND